MIRTLDVEHNKYIEYVLVLGKNDWNLKKDWTKLFSRKNEKNNA